MTVTTEQLMNYLADKADIYFKEIQPQNSGYLSDKFKNVFWDLFGKNKHLMKDDMAERHGVNSVFVMALDQIFAEPSVDLLKAHVRQIYKYVMGPFLDAQESKYSKIGDIKDIWAQFLVDVNKGNRGIYDNEYFQLSVIDSKDHREFGFNINRCLYYEIIEHNDMRHLGPILCMYDYIIANSWKKWIEFTRLGTIAEGGNHCSFRYKLKSIE